MGAAKLEVFSLIARNWLAREEKVVDRDLRNVLREAMVELETWSSSMEGILKKLAADMTEVRGTIRALRLTLTEMSTLP